MLTWIWREWREIAFCQQRTALFTQHRQYGDNVLITVHKLCATTNY